MTNYDDMKLSVEAISGGKNTVLLDDIGMPSVVVPFPKLKYSEVIAGGTQDTLPAFIVDGGELDVIHVSKYQNVVVNDRAYSLPFKDPTTNITFDRAVAVCRNKGAGWHLNTNALWAAIALWCYKNGTAPYGNSNYGQNYLNTHEKGIPSSSGSDGRTNRVATGSGPSTWYHNNDVSGIADLCGNAWEWVGGMRLVSGEIQMIPYGNAMKRDCDMGTQSAEWKAILEDGSLVAPGTEGTLKLDFVNSRWTVCKNITSSKDGNRFAKFSATAASGVNIPQILMGLGLFPAPDYTYDNGVFMANNGNAERVLIRGAGFLNVGDAGVAALSLYNPRSLTTANAGFRSAFCNGLNT